MLSYPLTQLLQVLSPGWNVPQKRAGQGTLIRKQITHPHEIKIQSVTVPPGWNSRKKTADGSRMWAVWCVHIKCLVSMSVLGGQDPGGPFLAEHKWSKTWCVGIERRMPAKITLSVSLKAITNLPGTIIRLCCTYHLWSVVTYNAPQPLLRAIPHPHGSNFWKSLQVQKSLFLQTHLCHF